MCWTHFILSKQDSMHFLLPSIFFSNYFAITSQESYIYRIDVVRPHSSSA